MSGWRLCTVRGRHWGPRGAAGLLPFAVTPDGIRVLLALRSVNSHDGGTWGTLGGAIEPGEAPWLAALREASEEAHGLEPAAGATADPRPGSHDYLCECGWTYTTFPFHLPDGAAVTIRNWENRELRWVPIKEVDRYPLHSGLARSWPELRKLIEAQARGSAT
jgi:8-oxo-dGTP diphosphatase